MKKNIASISGRANLAAPRAGTIPDGSIENGVLHIDKLEAAAPDGAEDLVLDLY